MQDFSTRPRRSLRDEALLPGRGSEPCEGGLRRRPDAVTDRAVGLLNAVAFVSLAAALAALVLL